MKYFVSILLLSLFVGCSDSMVDFKSDDVEGLVTNEELRIFNKLDSSIYYFAVEREIAAIIQWAPRSEEENEIKAYNNKEILLEDIYGYEKGKEIIFYYWASKQPDSGDIKSVVISTK